MLYEVDGKLIRERCIIMDRNFNLFLHMNGVTDADVDSRPEACLSTLSTKSFSIQKQPFEMLFKITVLKNFAIFTGVLL